MAGHKWIYVHIHPATIVDIEFMRRKKKNGKKHWQLERGIAVSVIDS